MASASEPVQRSWKRRVDCQDWGRQPTRGKAGSRGRGAAAAAAVTTRGTTGHVQASLCGVLLLLLLVAARCVRCCAVAERSLTHRDSEPDSETAALRARRSCQRSVRLESSTVLSPPSSSRWAIAALRLVSRSTTRRGVDIRHGRCQRAAALLTARRDETEWSARSFRAERRGTGRGVDRQKQTESRSRTSTAAITHSQRENSAEQQITRTIDTPCNTRTRSHRSQSAQPPTATDVTEPLSQSAHSQQTRHVASSQGARQGAQVRSPLCHFLVLFVLFVVRFEACARADGGRAGVAGAD